MPTLDAFFISRRFPTLTHSSVYLSMTLTPTLTHHGIQIMEGFWDAAKDVDDQTNKASTAL